jgi:hypothetical protein
MDRDALDAFLLDGGRMIPRTAAELATIPIAALREWANARSRYGIPSLELVAFLRLVIGERSAIEIGAGQGDLGSILGIRMTDSGMQRDPAIEAIYKMLGVETTKPPPDVELIDGNAAVRKYRPAVVVASWVTQFWRPEDGPDAQASMFGVDEGAILDAVECYVFIGNVNSHGQKRILARPHQAIYAPFLFSRAQKPELNCIWIWGS